MKFDDWSTPLKDSEKEYLIVRRLMREGYRIIRPEPESFKRMVNGRETVRIADEIVL